MITYVNEEYDSSKLNIQGVSDIWEGLYVEVKHNISNFRSVICNIYRRPRNNSNNQVIDRFKKELLPKLRIICDQNKDAEILLAGDFNIDLLKLPERLKFQESYDDLTNLSLFPKITLLTRIGSQSSTLIDYI